MGALYTRLFSKRETRIVIQGLDSAGKTSILYRLKLGEVLTTIPTIGFNVETLEYNNITITAWDVGGRDKMRPLWRHYFHDAQALVYVVDSNDHEEYRIQQARDELHSVLAEDELRDCILLVLANKQDLPNAWSALKMSEQLQLHKLGTRVVWNIFPTAAVTGDGLYEALDWLSEQLKQRPRLAKHQTKTKVTKVSSPDGDNHSNGDTVYTRIWGKLSQIFLGQS